MRPVVQFGAWVVAAQLLFTACPVTVVSGQTLPVLDATTTFTKSTESEFDHEVTVQDGLTFHWNDIKGNTFEMGLIHQASSLEEAPAWLGVGFFEGTASPSADLSGGSDAVVGIVQDNSVKKYSGAFTASIQEMERQTLLQSSIRTHDSDLGTVNTILTFTKELKESDTEEIQINAVGENALIWAFGQPSDGSIDNPKALGLISLDLNEVRAIAQSAAEGGTTGEGGGSEGGEGSATGEGAGGEAETGGDTQTGGEAETGGDTQTGGEAETGGETETGGEAETGGTSSTPGETDSGEDDASASDSDGNTAPVVLSTCGSNLVDANGIPYEKNLQLTKLMSLHWRLSSDGKMAGALRYDGSAWVAFGVSMDGQTIGSDAIIGLPDEGAVKKYEIPDQDEGTVVDLPSDGLFTGSVSTDEEGGTLMTFEAKLDDGTTHKITTTGLNTFLFAEGASAVFGFPQFRGTFRVDLGTCDGEETVGRSHMGAFAAHGVIATLAWGIASPFAVTVAWFRTLVPSSWIYIHVFSNVLSFFFTLVAVIVAISAMSVQTKASHFSDPHHWVGLLLLVAVTFQVMNGFLRPPVEKKNDPYAASHYDIEPGFMNMPKTPRQVWVFSHRLTGIVTISMGVYQIHSGLNAFARNYNVESIAPWFWGYVSLFAFCLVSLKFWIMFEEYKARRGMEAMHVDHRSNAGSSQGMSHAESELVPVQFDMS